MLSRAEDQYGGTYTRLASRQVSEALAEIDTALHEEDSKPTETISTVKPNEALSLPAKKVEMAREDATRATGEYATYKYYFNSIGIWKTLMMIGFCASYGFFINFSGMVPTHKHNSPFASHLVLTSLSQRSG